MGSPRREAAKVLGMLNRETEVEDNGRGSQWAWVVLFTMHAKMLLGLDS